MTDQPIILSAYREALLAAKEKKLARSAAVLAALSAAAKVSTHLLGRPVSVDEVKRAVKGEPEAASSEQTSGHTCDDCLYFRYWQSHQGEGEGNVGEQPVELLGDAIEATRQAKQELDEALWRLAAIETDHNREAKLPGADLARLALERTAAEDALGIQRLIERRHDAQRWAGLVDDAVRVCRRYSFERVIVAQIRRLLHQHAGPDEDLELFAMTLLRHVRSPDDPALYEAARTVLHRLRDHQPIAAATD